MSLTAAEQTISSDIGFDQSICALLKSSAGSDLQRAMFPNDDGDSVPGPGVAVDVADGDAAEQVIRATKPSFASLGYRAYWSVRYRPDGRRASNEVVVIKTDDPYEIVRRMQTDGANYDVFTDDIVSRLSAWESLCSFDLVGASRDWVALVFNTLPEKLCAFAEDVYLFCPDTFVQGIDLAPESKDPQVQAEARRICPDISPAIRARVEEQNMQISSMNIDVPEALSKFFASHDRVPETEMGVRLLARQIQLTKFIFLWWD
jgi:hypothetical protein